MTISLSPRSLTSDRMPPELLVELPMVTSRRESSSPSPDWAQAGEAASRARRSAATHGFSFVISKHLLVFRALVA
jgi:hypothetical protein